MLFCEKLRKLLSIFNVNSRSLALAIHIDPSSVSRWLNNKRVPYKNTQYIPKIAEFFVGIEATDSKKRELINLIAPDKIDMSGEQLKKALTDWLIKQDFNECDSRILNTLAQESLSKQIDELLANFNSFMKDTPLPDSIAYNTYDIKALHGDPCKVELFYGEKGIQTALLSLFSQLLELKSPHELLITNHDAPVWYVQDEFIAKWMEMLISIIRKGHKIKIIFKMNRDLSQVRYFLKIWLPLILSGGVEAYYYQKYEKNVLALRLAVIPDISSLHSLVSEGTDTYFLTFLHRDLTTTEFFKRKFNHLLKFAQPLVKFYSGDSLYLLHEETTAIEEKPGNQYIFKWGLNSSTIPLNLYKKILENSGMPDAQIQKILSLHKRRLSAFQKHIGIYLYREVCPLSIIDLMINPQGFEYSPIDIFRNSRVSICPEDILEYLKHIVKLLEDNPNYMLALTVSDETVINMPISWAVKEGQAVMVSSWDKFGQPSVVTSTESTLVSAFEGYYEDLWSYIPENNRAKDWVIGKLLSRIQILEKFLHVRNG